MSNKFKAHIHPQSVEDDETQIVGLELFNHDGSPAEIGGGGGASEPVFGRFYWEFANPNFADDNAIISFDDIMVGQSRSTGFETNDTKLLLPAGIYQYSASYNNNVGNVSGTYYGLLLNFNYEWEEGMPDFIYPPQLSLNSGVGAIGQMSEEIPYATSGAGHYWGIAETDSYLEIGINTDFVDLEGDVGIHIARVSAF